MCGQHKRNQPHKQTHTHSAYSTKHVQELSTAHSGCFLNALEGRRGVELSPPERSISGASVANCARTKRGRYRPCFGTTSDRWDSNPSANNWPALMLHSQSNDRQTCLTKNPLRQAKIVLYSRAAINTLRCSSSNQNRHHHLTSIKVSMAARLVWLYGTGTLVRVCVAQAHTGGWDGRTRLGCAYARARAWRRARAPAPNSIARRVEVCALLVRAGEARGLSVSTGKAVIRQGDEDPASRAC